MMELVPKPEKPNEFMIFVMDHIFNPVETQDWIVEKIIVHPQEWALFRKNYGPDHLDMNAVQELRDAGLYAHLFNANIYVDATKPRGHIEVVYGNLEKTNHVCLMTKRLAGAVCDNLTCLVDYVHDL